MKVDFIDISIYLIKSKNKYLITPLVKSDRFSKELLKYFLVDIDDPIEIKKSIRESLILSGTPINKVVINNDSLSTIQKEMGTKKLDKVMDDLEHIDIVYRENFNDIKILAWESDIKKRDYITLDKSIPERKIKLTDNLDELTENLYNNLIEVFEEIKTKKQKK